MGIRMIDVGNVGNIAKKKYFNGTQTEHKKVIPDHLIGYSMK